MSLERGAFGIEYTPRKAESDKGAINILLIVIVVVALVSLGVSLYRRGTAKTEEERQFIEITAQTESPAVGVVERAVEIEVPDVPPAPEIEVDEFDNRPSKVRTLLQRLQTAEKNKDVEMAVQTIEKIRAIPGNPTADIDDKLARRLGTLNVLWLFERHNAQWVKTVNVRNGTNASRIAAESGSTLASLEKLNGDVSTVRTGQKLLVMDHPRFNLVIHRRSRTADLSLNGKFFKRYDLVDEVKGKDGMYEVTTPYRNFWRELGTIFPRPDRVELEMLMPKGASVIITEL